MASYGQVTRTPDKPSEVQILTAPPAGWDNAEERELEALARGASALAWHKMSKVNEAKAAETRRHMLNEVRQSR